jgi:hypothetical protein
MSPRAKRLSASEVGQYAFCPYAWWLGSVEGKKPIDYGALEDGVRAHERHGWRVAVARGIHKLAWWMLVAAGAALLIWATSALVLALIAGG